MKNLVKVSGFLAALLCPQLCLAVSSAELYTSKSYGYGRFEARLRFAPNDGAVSAFFLWKDGSEKAGAYWNELDFEKLGANCHYQSNAIYGNPSANHTTDHTPQADLCGAYHTYTYEWTADTVTWLVDGAVIRKETGATAQAFAQNASIGMQFHFNLWPGDSSFGGNLNPSALPLHQYIDWVQYSTYADGAFTLAWREDFNAATLPDGWLTGDWGSPKNQSTHAPGNVNFINGFAVLSLTADNAVGPAGAMPGGSGGTTSGTAGSGGAPASGGTSNASAGSPAVGGSPSGTGSAGSPASSGTAGSPGSNGSAGSQASTGTAGASNTGVAGTGTVPSGGAASAPGSSSGSKSDGCNVGRAPGTGAWWWTLGIPALAFLRRRLRRELAA